MLLKKRRQIISSNEEGFTFALTQETETTNMISKEPSGIVSVKPTYSNLQLREYCIKSSYNSSLSGEYISIQAIKYVLSRGCRFIDFEVFFINNAPCVAYSTDPTFITVTSKNYITLNQAFQTIITNGFSAPSPNASDPLFIQLRIKSNNADIYNLIGMAIQNYLTSRLYTGSVDGTTILSELNEKIVLIIDKNVSPTYALLDNYPKCNNSAEITNTGCYNLKTFTNIESGTGTLRKYSYSNLLNQATTPPVILDSNNQDTDISLLRIVVPDTNIKILQNPDSNDFILNYGVQFITNNFFINDSNLKNYEKIFHDNKTAFIPYSNAITYFKN